MLNQIRVSSRMTNFKHINKGRLITVGFALPMLLWAYSSGPPEYHDGGPGSGSEGGGGANACATARCHVGTAVNQGGGKVELQFPGGLTYTPGERQRIRVVITDTNSTTRSFGFQLSARLTSSEANGQAGRFTAGAGTIIICGNARERSASGNCDASAPVEFIEHSRPADAGVFEVDWMPPTSNVGGVKFYVAGNASNRNGVPSGDRIYTANATLNFQAGGGGGNRPEIKSGGVVVIGSYAAGVVTGSWVSIFGNNLSATTKDWGGLISAAGDFPTSIDGVSVTVDGKTAFMNYVSPGQVNIQVPDLAGKVGPVQVIVKNAVGESLPFSVNAAKENPSLFSYNVGTKNYPAAVRGDAAIIGPAGTAGVVPAKTGEVILIFGTGFGPTNPVVAAGKTFSGAAPLVDRVQMRIGNVSVTPSFAGLSGPGLNQFNVTVPQLANGEHAVEMTINGVSIQTGLLLAVQN
ncbi:MAG: choice-of-anchor V domain-containing protein [Bryobacteraceae bacterium]